MNIEPIAGTKNRVFIVLDKEEKKTSGGIILVEDDDKSPNSGIVVAVSSKDDNGTSPNVQVGDYVYFSENAGIIQMIEGEEYLILKESEIYAKRRD